MVEQAPSVQVTRTHLQLSEPSQLAAAPAGADALAVRPLNLCPPSRYRYLYEEVGRPYYWVDRLEWSDEQIQAHLLEPGISIWIAMVKGTAAGYFELARHDDGSLEIAYIGLFPAWIGKGLGRPLICAAVQRAWSLGANRVWLHTCTLDHPAALPTYLKLGFEPFKEETYTQALSAS